MSKTDKTRPWWVRVSEQPLVTCVPVHQHHLGECTLPADPLVCARDRSGFGWNADRCYWAESVTFFHARGFGCGCAMCTAKDARRVERRAVRHVGKQVCRDARREYGSVGAEEFAGFDDHVEVTPAW